MVRINVPVKSGGKSICCVGQFLQLLLRTVFRAPPEFSSASFTAAFLCLTPPFFSWNRIFRGRLDHWKAKPSSAAPASPRSPCMPFSWFHESRKGSYSFRNLPSPPSPLQPSPETLISDKKGSKVENTWIKKANKKTPNLFLLFNLWEAFSTCVYALDPRNQCDNTAINSAWYFLCGEQKAPLTITFFNTGPC